MLERGVPVGRRMCPTIAADHLPPPPHEMSLTERDSKKETVKVRGRVQREGGGDHQRIPAGLASSGISNTKGTCARSDSQWHIYDSQWQIQDSQWQV